MKRVLLATGLVGLAVLLFARSIGWAVVERGLRADFPEVRQITADSLAALLSTSSAPLLFDVRTAEEFGVSHLAGAQRVEPGAEAVEGLDTFPRDTPIVVYCSVGYRSAALARHLQSAGFTRVANLRGSLFGWANEGRALVRAGAPAHEVHPYDQRWGLLLRRPLRADMSGVHN